MFCSEIWNSTILQFSMDTKIQRWMAVCLVFTLRGSLSQNLSTTPDAQVMVTETLVADASATPSPTPTDGRKSTSGSNQNASGLQTLNTPAGRDLNPTSTVKVPASVPINKSTAPTTKPLTTTVTTAPTTSGKTVTRNKSWDDPFNYDYNSLRSFGLSVAAVLFILGIMVLCCGKLSCTSSRCHRRKGKSYQVTRM
ncbi:hypothetical protein DPEC_G00145530 [Dallia pectoralis]|uniref:Uncharacterized protein n=1 Tax=Dallia pectoralis TaxID=75939 RepID=A0ACC2GP50_DALPE|nr:hypothetical protein DPEC_G00145530 [Dallia pectoralis]